MKKRWLRPVSILFSAIALLFLGAYFLLQTPPVTRLILGRIREYLQVSSKIDLRASGMTFNLLKRSVTLEDVVIRSTSAPDLPPFFSASRIYAKPGIISILRGVLDIEELQISGPTIHYLIQRDGRTNVPASAKSSRPTPKFLVADANVTDASFFFTDLRNNLLLSLPRWRLRVSGDRLTFDHTIDFITQRSSSLRYRDRTIPIAYVTILGILNNKGMHLGMAQVASLNSRLTAKGSLNDFSNPSIHLQLEPTLDLNAITSRLGWQQPMQGILSGKITADGTLHNLDILAELNGLDVSGLEYSRVSFDFKSRAQWDAQRVLLRNFELNSSQGAVWGNAEFPRERGRGANVIRAKLANLDLYPLWKLIKPPFDLASYASGNVSLSWKGPFKASNIDATANLNLLAARTVPNLYILPISGNLDAQMRSGRLLGNLRAMSVMGAQLGGGFSLTSFKTVEADIRGETPDLGSSLFQVAQFVGGTDPILGVKTAGPVQFTAQVSGRLANPKIAAAAHSPALEIDALKDLAVKVDAVIENLHVPFHATIAMPDKSLISARGALGFGGPKTTLKLDARTDRIAAPDVLPVLGTDIPLTGDLKASLYLDGPLNDLTGHAAVSGNHMVLYQEPLGAFAAELRISEGEIQSNQFRITRRSAQPRDVIASKPVSAIDRVQGSFNFRQMERT